MSVTTTLGFRDKVIEVLEREIPGLMSVQKVKGALTEEGLARLSVRAPGALVAVLGFREMVPLDVARYRANLVMAIFVVTEGQDRLDEGHNLLEQVGLLIAGNTWGVPGAKMPKEIKGEPIYDDRYRDRQERTQHLQEDGWFLQAISWTQEVTVIRTLRADDKATQLGVGRSVDDKRWPADAPKPEVDYTPVRDTEGDNKTVEV